jgi:Glyoxalase/Bleomycin resistance protein/Dioxygenase superfamily
MPSFREDLTGGTSGGIKRNTQATSLSPSPIGLSDRAMGRESVHHLGYFVEDIDAEISNMDSRGFAMVQNGRGFGTANDGAYAYFDTENACGCILEALEMPQEMPPPEADLP